MKYLVLLIAGTLAWQASAQSTIAPDSSGNGMLQGAYHFRQLIYSTNSTGGITRSSSLYGDINFDGKGGYTVSGQSADSQTSSGQPQAFQVSGKYSIGSNGQGQMDDPLVSGETVLGLVAQGIFVGSSTEGQINDVLIAVPAGSTAATNATLQGSYWVAFMDIPGSDPAQVRDAFFRLNANGAGGITGAVNATGYMGDSETAVNQTLPNVTYSFSGGTGTLTFPTGGTLIGGSKLFYVSPDGNFAIGGSAAGYDLFVAVRAATGTASNALFKGLYYTVGIEEDNFDLAGSGAYFDTFWGAQSVNGAGTIIRHERIAPFNASAYGWTFDTVYTLNADGTYDRPSFRYGVGVSGLGFVGIGKGPLEAIVLGVRAPDFSGAGVYLNPIGVVNAASFAPFTAGIAPGELITLYGSNLAASSVTASGLPFPTTLNNVQVRINGTLAPIYYVTPGQISVIVPYATAVASSGTSYAQIQVTNNGTASNTVTVISNATSPGVFSSQQNGIGTAAVLHADFSVVTAANPAKRGETVLVYLTGLGAVSPTSPDGAAGPSNPLSNITADLSVNIDGIDSTVSYAGLAPGLAGLYQINVQVPNDVTSPSTGVYLDINTADGETTQVTIPIR
jgi:uncharacterized protein (TIGR03437 family)